MICHKNKKGFTLIELLVAISIIGLLSSIVLASLNQVRAKARNTARNNQVEEYAKALALYKSNSPGNLFPVAVGSHEDYPLCLGSYVYSWTGSCGQYYSGPNIFLGIDDEPLNNALRIYIASLPRVGGNKAVDINASSKYLGATFQCDYPPPDFNQDCNKGIIEYYLEGTSATCTKPLNFLKDDGGGVSGLAYKCRFYIE